MREAIERIARLENENERLKRENVDLLGVLPQYPSKVVNSEGRLINYDLVTAATIPIRRHLKIKAEATPYHLEYIDYFAKPEKLGHLM